MYVFYILIFILAILLWMLLSWLYKPIGKLGRKLWDDVKDTISEKDENENEDLIKKE